MTTAATAWDVVLWLSAIAGLGFLVVIPLALSFWPRRTPAPVTDLDLDVTVDAIPTPVPPPERERIVCLCCESHISARALECPICGMSVLPAEPTWPGAA